MTRAAKAIEAAKQNPKGLSFAQLRSIVEAAGFTLKRVSGSHHVYSRPGIAEIINIQPAGKDAKPYQVRQVLELIERYKLTVQ